MQLSALITGVWANVCCAGLLRLCVLFGPNEMYGRMCAKQAQWAMGLRVLYRPNGLYSPECCVQWAV